MPTFVQSPTPDFISYVLKDPVNRLYAWIAIAICIVSWFLFKYFYPNPNIIFDSYYYIMGATSNEDVSAWPIGYSKFIKLIGMFTHAVNALLILQFVILEVCFLFFFFSVRYFFYLSRLSSNILFVLIFLNPIYLYTCNLVLSDALFLGLSLVWIINLFWIIFRPQVWMVITQALLLFVTFSMRHSAMYYPIIGCVALFFSQLRLGVKIFGICFQFLLVGGFILYTTHLNERIYGVRQFSPFESWKVASNALYVYEHVPENEKKAVPVKFKELDKEVRQFYKTKKYQISLFTPDPSWGSYYMFMFNSPLISYQEKKLGMDSIFYVLSIKNFSKMAPLYDEYGKFILKSYPFTYAKNFVVPNIWIYMLPYPEVYYDDYNPFTFLPDTLGGIAKNWFGKISLTAPRKNVVFRTTLFTFYPVINMLIHFIFIITGIGFYVLKGYRRMKAPYFKGILMISILWLLNFGFIIIASASLLRYQLFITVVELVFMLFFIDFLYVKDNQKHPLEK
ncbi:hypothetical protein SIO70_00370 [Chitinophaga sancti]|uniref:hypothetical protein n=1 Tax=Chitinophaga sancti TaxID=1004 RepID=UPI002A755F17|nr:hypothetical protein [Chitinophaga sancti]WPQ63317.1 hypothetical protein SIO70_00370 [Chitinophaga sancti]